MGLSQWLWGKESTCNTRDPSSIPESWRSLGAGSGNPLQYSCQENPMDREDWLVAVHSIAKSQTGWSNLACTIRTMQESIASLLLPFVRISDEKPTQCHSHWLIPYRLCWFSLAFLRFSVSGFQKFNYYMSWYGFLLFSSVQSLSHVRLFATPWTAARQASLSITNSWSSRKLMSIKSVMPSSHLILSSPSPPGPNPSQHQSLFQWVSSSHEVAKVLEFQL